LALAAKFDIEEWAKPPEKKDEKKKGEEAKAQAEDEDDEKPAAPPEAMRLDVEGISERQFILPIPPGNYSGLEALPGAVAYVSNPVEGLADDTWPDPPAPKGTLQRFEILDKKATALAQKIRRFALSADASTIAYSEMNDEGDPALFKVIGAMGPPAVEGKDDDDSIKKIDLEDQQVRVDVPSEWRQILSEARGT
jgi:tricorn protease